MFKSVPSTICWVGKKKILINKTQNAGYRSVIWNATNDYGKPVSAGIYLYQIQAGEYISTKIECAVEIDFLLNKH